jgi:hypothetical protein
MYRGLLQIPWYTVVHFFLAVPNSNVSHILNDAGEAWAMYKFGLKIQSASLDIEVKIL